MVQVLETNLEQLKDKLATIKTSYNKADYLESAFKKDFSLETKKFILATLAELYEKDKLFEKAARAMSNKARFDVTFKEKIESNVKSAEFFCKIGKIEDAEEMFSRAAREANESEKRNIIRQRKEMYFRYAEYLEKIGKKSSSMRFYEKLIKIRLDEKEKEIVKDKLIRNYKLLGRFRDAELLAGL